MILSFANVQIGAENQELLALTNAIGYTTTGHLVAGKTAATTSEKMNMAKLMKIAEGGLDEYYYYYGSLTFPANSLADYPTHSCAEIVTWILPTKKLTISPAQLADFQKIMFTAVGQLDNNRLIQTGASISGSYRRLGDSISGIDWINSLISSIMNTGPPSLSSSGNPVFIRRVDQPSSYTTEETAVQYARAGVAAVTSIAATSLISSPPDLGGELTNNMFQEKFY